MDEQQFGQAPNQSTQCTLHSSRGTLYDPRDRRAVALNSQESIFLSISIELPHISSTASSISLPSSAVAITEATLATGDAANIQLDEPTPAVSECFAEIGNDIAETVNINIPLNHRDLHTEITNGSRKSSKRSLLPRIFTPVKSHYFDYTEDVTRYLYMYNHRTKKERAFQGCLPDIELALSKGEDPNSKDPMGNTAIHKAAANGNLTCLQRLMKQGGDVSQEDAAGCTVLHVAARNGHIETVKWLITNGCDINTLSRKGNTARDLARANGQSEVSKYLKEYGREKFDWETAVN
ncbi:putative E3 ubiquitin-protein ligase HACE1-like [Apostichopus japonicus]|uniref:Putative E3 ubiquitin-protein ligase HACE1-like n=1 Tax=Stichopus japonicus TaxID=307972 RepID=A0A2G8KL87_STIJA|nr:putative E3 ubiquitin-protein ligase HACE1-like [Apostichopus japonicus]